MQIDRHDGIEKDFKDLKRFPGARESLDSWERLFAAKGLRETPSIDQCSGYGDRKIYKARVVALRENFGKSKGYRVVFELKGSHVCVVLVFSRHGIYHTEGELIAMIKARL